MMTTSSFPFSPGEASMTVRRAIRTMARSTTAALLLPAALGAQAAGAPPATQRPPADSAARAAQATTPALPGPAVRRIESAQAISTEPLGAITNVRHLSDGRVLVNDGTRRRLLMMDSTLQVTAVVLDSLTEVQNAYGTRAGTLLAYRGDSSVFIDAATYAMLVLDGDGTIARVRAVPRAQDINYITNPSMQYGVPGFDQRGRLVHRIAARTAPPAVAPPPGVPYFPSPPDSAFIVAVDLDSRKADTLGVVRIPRVVYSMRMEPEGYYNINVVPNPLPLTDDWALLPDGKLAFARGQDYRFEFRAPDGTITSAEKLPFPWVRLDEDAKSRFADSAKAVQIKSAQTNYATQVIAWSNLLNKPYPATFSAPEGYVPPAGLPKDWILPKGVSFPPNYLPACPPGVTPPQSEVMMMSLSGVAITQPSGGAAPADSTAPRCTRSYFAEMYGNGYTPPAPTYRAPTLVKPSDLPDYKPPITLGSVRADADGNLWVRTMPMTRTAGGIIFDVVDGKGTMIDRIQLPPGYQLVGFGEGRVVYLSNRDAKGLHLSRVRLK